MIKKYFVLLPLVASCSGLGRSTVNNMNPPGSGSQEVGETSKSKETIEETIDWLDELKNKKKYKAMQDMDRKQALFYAIDHDLVDYERKFPADIDPNATIEYQRSNDLYKSKKLYSCLTLGVTARRGAIVDWVYKAGGNLDQSVGGIGYTALHVATSLGDQHSIMRRLLKLGANPNIPLESDGSILLHKVVKNNWLKSLNILLSYSPNIDAQDYLGYTALMYAAVGSNLNMCIVLLKAGANKKIQNKDGKTAYDLILCQAHNKDSYKQLYACDGCRSDEYAMYMNIAKLLDPEAVEDNKDYSDKGTEASLHDQFVACIESIADGTEAPIGEDSGTFCHQHHCIAFLVEKKAKELGLDPRQVLNELNLKRSAMHLGVSPIEVIDFLHFVGIDVEEEFLKWCKDNHIEVNAKRITYRALYRCVKMVYAVRSYTKKNKNDHNIMLELIDKYYPCKKRYQCIATITLKVKELKELKKLEKELAKEPADYIYASGNIDMIQEYEKQCGVSYDNIYRTALVAERGSDWAKK